MMSILDRFLKFKDLNWSLLDQVLASGVNFSVSFLLARYIGVEQFGLYSMIWLVIVFINSVQLSFITSPMMSRRYSLENRPYYNFYYTLLFYFNIATSSIMALILVLYKHFLDPSISTELVISIVMASFFYQFQDFHRRYFFCVENYKFGFLSDLLSYGPRGLLILFFCLNSDINIPRVLFIIGCTSCVSFVYFLFNVNQLKIDTSILIARFRDNWTYSKWLIISSVVRWFSGNFIFFVISYFLGNYYVGIAKAMHNLVGLVNIVFQALENFIPIRMVKVNSDLGMYSLQLMTDKLLYIGGSITFLIGWGLLSYAEVIISLIYGGDYVSYSYIVAYFIPAYVFIYFGLINRLYLRTIGKTKLIFLAEVVSMIVMFLFSYYFTLKYGLVGSLLSFNLSLFVFFFLSYFRVIGIIYDK